MATKNSDLSGLWLSPMVVAARMPILMYESLNPDPSRRDETNRMVAEKVAAAQEGMLAAQVALGKAIAHNAAAMFFGRIPHSSPGKTAEAMVQAGLAPMARRVRANAKRLAKR
jgi:heme A synthase